MAERVAIRETGGPDVLAYESFDPGEPGEGEVLIAQAAVGLNFIDVYHRSGYYPLPALPHGIGLEAAGEVVETGPGVEWLEPGDRVAYVTPPPGAYATERVLPAAKLIKLPEGISNQLAAGMMLKGLTAQYLLRQTYRVAPGETILIHAAAGGVGLILCQWASHLGARVIGTVGSEEKAELARAHGCEYPILYREEDVVRRVKEITDGEGCPVVYDSVGKDTFEKSLDSLARRGMMVSFGQSSGPVEPVPPVLLSSKGSLYLTRPTLFDYTVTRQELEAAAEDLFAVVEAGKVSIEVNQRFSLSEAADAHRALEARETTGSTILVAR
ncbi:MAG: quinone oxidoreductase family protein [Spirochaetaceae bacterium]